jgi:glycerol-3-phosphate O-acyltransferase
MLREACELFARAGHLEIRRPGSPLAPSKRKPGVPGLGAIYMLRDEGRLALDIAKNVLVHFFVGRSLLATALLAGASGRAAISVSLPRLREQVLSLSKLFKYEFQFRADASFDDIFKDEVDKLLGEGALERIGDVIVAESEAGRDRLAMHASIVVNFLESYRIAARAVAEAGAGPFVPRDLVKKALAVGERLFLEDEISRREAVNAQVFANAFNAFVDQGYLTRRDGKYEVPETYADADVRRTIEAKIAAFLPAR